MKKLLAGVGLEPYTRSSDHQSSSTKDASLCTIPVRLRWCPVVERILLLPANRRHLDTTPASPSHAQLIHYTEWPVGEDTYPCLTSRDTDLP